MSMSSFRISEKMSFAQVQPIIRHAFQQNSSANRVAMLLAGGSTSGNPIVVQSTADCLNHAGYALVGMRHGFVDLVHTEALTENRHFFNLESPQDRAKAGYMCTSRENPLQNENHEPDKNFFSGGVLDPERHVGIILSINKLLALGISGIIIVGGDGTTSLAHCMDLIGVPVVHIPRGHDNNAVLNPLDDQADQTFGHDSVVTAMMAPLRQFKAELVATCSFGFGQVIGRTSSSLAYTAAVAANSDPNAVNLTVNGVWGPEDVAENEPFEAFCNRITDELMHRRRRGWADGFYLLCQGLGIIPWWKEDVGKAMKDPLFNDRPGTINIADIIAARCRKRFRSKFLSAHDRIHDRIYEFRVVPFDFANMTIPVSGMAMNDITLCNGLGMAAAKFVVADVFGVSVRWNASTHKPYSVPISDLVDSCGVSRKRNVSRNSALYHQVELMRRREESSYPEFPF